MAETLETLAERITALTALTRQMPTRAHVDEVTQATRAQMDEMQSALLTHIEAVDTKVGVVLEKVEHLVKRDIYHSVVHARFDQRLEDHELRLMALESPRVPPTRDDE